MADDPYRYFRIEAREILEGLTSGLLDLEQGAPDPEILPQLLRFAHTLKGAARVVKQARIAETAHTLEEGLARLRDGADVMSSDTVDGLLQLLEVVASELGTLPEQSAALDARGSRLGEPRAAPVPPLTRPPEPLTRDRGELTAGEERFETVRVEVAEMDALLDGISESMVQIGAVRAGADLLAQVQRMAAALLRQLDPATATASELGARRAQGAAERLYASLGQARRQVVTGIDRIERECGQVQRRANTLRLVPASALFGPLELTVRDIAQSLGKQVEFDATGGETRLDGHVLSALRQGLLHVVRNAVDHGIETEAERVAAGKPPVGRVSLHVVRRGHRVAFVCRDDGRGIDAAEVRASAVRRGVITEAEAQDLGDQQSLALVFQAGMTTRGVITTVSGRGVGLDIVRELAARFKGDAVVTSERGRGTTIDISMPVSLSSLTALALDNGGAVVLVPLDAVVGTLRLGVDEILQGASSASVMHDGQVIPFVPLARILGGSSVERVKRRTWSVVVLRASSQRLAVGVDRLVGTADVVIKPLPASIGPLPLIVGAALDVDGDPELLLDPKGLIEMVRVAAHPFVVSAPPPPIPPILVVDDSLTTRMLEQSILESAGYTVDVAASGPEGLSRARSRAYGLFILDVEMPGMNGFELTQTIRAEPALRSTPIIMVTSLTSAADRRRGMEAGASAYLAKSDFDQGRFLLMVRELMG